MTVLILIAFLKVGEPVTLAVEFMSHERCIAARDMVEFAIKELKPAVWSSFCVPK